MRPTLTLMLVCTLIAGPALAAEERIVPASDRKAIGDTTTLADTAVMQTISLRVREEQAAAKQ